MMLTYLLFFSILCLSGVFNQSLIILHSANIRGRYQQTDSNARPCQNEETMEDVCIGGVPRTVSLIRQHRSLSDNGGPMVIYLYGGDTFQGTLWFSTIGYQGAVMCMNLLKPDALVIGCREFQRGMNSFKSFVDGVESPIVVSNMDTTNEMGLNKIKKSHVVQRNNLRVGILGYLDPRVTKFYDTGNITFQDPVEALKEESVKLHIEGVQLIIAIGHMTFNDDQYIAASVPLIDVIVGGHSDTLLFNGQPRFKLDSNYYRGTYPKFITQANGKEVALVYAHSYSKYLGRLNITLNRYGYIVNIKGQPIPLVNSVPQDPNALERFDMLAPFVDVAETSILGSTKVILDATECGHKECNIGNLITDAFVDCIAEEKNIQRWTDTPIAFIPGGDLITVDTTSVGGNISAATMYTALESNHEVSTCSLYGNDLKKVIELSAESGETADMPEGAFLQVSGIHVEIDMNKPIGSRVVSLRARCGTCATPRYKRVHSQGVYNIISYKSIIRGGSGYDIMKRACFNVKHYNVTDCDAVMRYIMRHKMIYPQIQERIKIKDKNISVCVKSENIFFIVISLVLVPTLLIYS